MFVIVGKQQKVILNFSVDSLFITEWYKKIDCMLLSCNVRVSGWIYTP